MVEERHYSALDLRDMDDKYSGKRRRRLPASPVVVRRRRRGRAVSPSVQADTFRPIPARVPGSVALLGVRTGTISLQVASGQGAAYSQQRPLRARPQARIPRVASERDREPIDGAMTPGAHEAIGRALLSPILYTGGSDW